MIRHDLQGNYFMIRFIICRHSLPQTSYQNLRIAPSCPAFYHTLITIKSIIIVYIIFFIIFPWISIYGFHLRFRPLLHLGPHFKQRCIQGPLVHRHSEVRKIEELDACEALVIPGGESTTMKIIAGTDELRGLKNG